MAHQKKLTQGEKLKNVAQLTEKGLDYALAQTKEVYVKYGKKNKKFILHEWNSEDRRDLFRQLVREYLNYANKQAEDGVNIETDNLDRT